MLLKRAGPHKSDGIHPLEIRMLMSMKALQNRNHPNEKLSFRKNNLLLLIRSQHSYFIRPESGHSPKFPNHFCSGSLPVPTQLHRWITGLYSLYFALTKTFFFTFFVSFSLQVLIIIIYK